jgi:hypothetical protein
MIIRSQMLQDRFSVSGSVRLDRGFAERESAERKLENWLHQIAGKIRVALNRRIPVGFEDETGFHLGVQVVSGVEAMEWERAGIFADDNHF